MKGLKTYLIALSTFALLVTSCKDPGMDDPTVFDPLPENAISFSTPVAEVGKQDVVEQSDAQAIEYARNPHAKTLKADELQRLDDGTQVRSESNGLTQTLVPTRAMTNSFVSGDVIGVLGYFLDDGEWNSTATTPADNEIPNFMYNQRVTMGNDGLWRYSPLKYWSNDPADRIKFFAYYPVKTTSVRLLTQNDDPGYPKLSFATIANTSFSRQIDLLYAQTEELDKATSANKIDLPFEHALAKIRISGKMVVDPLDDARRQNKYTIKSITINSPTKATLSGSPTGASWSDHNTYDNWIFDYTEEGTVPGEVMLKESSTMLVGGSEEDNALLLIPDRKLTATVVFDYTYSVRPDEEYTETISNVSYEITLDDFIEAGKSYHFALEFGSDADALRPKVTAKSNLTDWGGTFDIPTDVVYTFLYVEKPDFTIEYTTLDPITLKVYFTTNADAEKISAEYVREEGVTYPPEQLSNTQELKHDADDGWYVECVLHPDLDYNKEILLIKTGLIGVNININLIAQQPYYLMDPMETNTYLQLDPNVGTVTETMFSNCYFITPSDKYARKYYIPITQQIQYAEAKLGVSATNSVLTTGDWKVKLYAYDNAEPVNMLWLYNEGLIGYEEGTYVGPKHHCFSIVIPANYTNPGNMIVVVTDADDTVLWTWHLWISNYDPYAIYATVEDPIVTTDAAGYKLFKYESAEYGGAIYRHAHYDYSYILDRNVGAIDDTYEGHGGLGNTGWVMYQYGRPTPLLGYSARYADGSEFSTIKHNVNVAGKVSMLTAVQNPNVWYFSPTGEDWCNEAGRNGKVWNDPDLDHPEHSANLDKDADYYKKSRFDPSPLGYMLFPLKEIAPYSDAWKLFTEYTPSGAEVKYYQMSSGNNIYGTININGTTGNTSTFVDNVFTMWSNSSYPSSNKAGSLDFSYYVTTPNVAWNDATDRTRGASVRCIDQFKETRGDRVEAAKIP